MIRMTRRMSLHAMMSKLMLAILLLLFANCCAEENFLLNARAPRFKAHVRVVISVFLGDRMRLRCAAVGSDTLYVHWFHNGVMQNDTQPVERVRMQSATHQVLLITRVEISDHGSWSCKVWNQHGTIWRNFTVEIIDLCHYFEPRPLAEVPADCKCDFWHRGVRCAELTELQPSDCVTLLDRRRLNAFGYATRVADHRSCDSSTEYTHPNPNSTTIDAQMLKEWGIDGKHIPHAARPYFKVDGTVERPDEGDGDDADWKDYIADAPRDPTDADAAPPHAAAVKDQGPKGEFDYNRAPTFTERTMQPMVASPAGRDVKLPCRATGHPEPQIVWLRDGREIGADSKRPSLLPYVQRRFVLVLEDVVPTDGGVYTCVVGNRFGNITHDYELKVVERMRTRPLISHGYPKNATVYAGDNATFLCPVISDLSLWVEWFKYQIVNGSYVDDLGQPYVLFAAEMDGAVTETLTDMPEKSDVATHPSRLHLSNVSYEHAGRYACLAGNSLGGSVAEAWLVVLDPDDRPKPAYDATVLVLSVLGALVLVLFFGFLLLLFYLRRAARKDALVYAESAVLVAPLKVVKLVQRPFTDYDDDLVHMPEVRVVTVSRPARFSSELVTCNRFRVELDGKLDEYEIDPERLKIFESIGEGAFGQVFRAELEGRPCAVKTLRLSAEDKEMEALILEMVVMKTVGRHPNVLCMLATCTQREGAPVQMVVELCANGNLRDFLRRQRPTAAAAAAAERSSSNSAADYLEPDSRKRSLSPQSSDADQRVSLTNAHLAQFCFQVARGMEYLISRKCVHRDLAARNVMVTSDLVMKIGDFGLARQLNYVDYYKKKTKGVVPLKWMAPESLKFQRYTAKSDVWSFGVLTWEVMTLGGTPYPSVPLQSLWELLDKGYRMEQPPGCPQAIYDLMLACWAPDPDRRRSFAEIVVYLERLLLTYKRDEYLECIECQSVSTDVLDDDDDEAMSDAAPSTSRPRPPPIDCAAAELQASFDSAVVCDSPAARQPHRSGATAAGSPTRKSPLRPISESFEADFTFDHAVCLDSTAERVDAAREQRRRQRRGTTADSGHPSSSPAGSSESFSSSDDARLSAPVASESADARAPLLTAEPMTQSMSEPGLSGSRQSRGKSAASSARQPLLRRLAKSEVAPRRGSLGSDEGSSNSSGRSSGGSSSLSSHDRLVNDAFDAPTYVQVQNLMFSSARESVV